MFSPAFLPPTLTTSTGAPTHIMETIEGTAIYPPSMLQHVNGLVIPGGQEAFTADYSCAKRCTYVPLGGLSGQPVTIAGGGCRFDLRVKG